MKRIELAPLSPFHDLEGTVRKIRAAKPGITDQGVNQAVKRMLDGYNPRTPGRIVHLFGRDILTEDVTSIPAWPWVGEGEKRRVLQHPVMGGETIPDDLVGITRKMRQEELAGRGSEARASINRSVLISPPGLQQTYVWRLATGWVQEVTDADYDLILSTPANRRLFRDLDIHGPYVDVRSYEAPRIVTSTTVATTAKEASYLMGQTKRTPNWQGSDLSKR